MHRIHRWSVMIYGSLQAEFMETKFNSHIRGCGTPVFGKIVVSISKSINNKNQIFSRLSKIIRFDMPSVLLALKAGLFQFCFIPCFFNFCIEEVQVGVIYICVELTDCKSKRGQLGPNETDLAIWKPCHWECNQFILLHCRFNSDSVLLEWDQCGPGEGAFWWTLTMRPNGHSYEFFSAQMNHQLVNWVFYDIADNETDSFIVSDIVKDPIDQLVIHLSCIADNETDSFIVSDIVKDPIDQLVIHLSW